MLEMDEKYKSRLGVLIVMQLRMKTVGVFFRCSNSSGMGEDGGVVWEGLVTKQGAM